eukprot:CFRG2933T1
MKDLWNIETSLFSHVRECADSPINSPLSKISTGLEFPARVPSPDSDVDIAELKRSKSNINVNTFAHSNSLPNGCGLDIEDWELTNGHSRYFRDYKRNLTLHYRTFGDPANPLKILFIMGLATNCAAWMQQAKHFQDHYHVCCYDNRGTGRSDAPIRRYTTSLMAEDAACLLDHLKWDRVRSVHVTGISMGGMIAQELALLVPERILSLTLIATFSDGLHLRRMPHFSGVLKFLHTSVSFWKGDEEHTDSMMRFLYTQRTIDENDEELKNIHYTIINDGPVNLFGHVLQFIATITHHLSNERLKLLRFQPFKTFVISGAEDDAVPIRNSQWIAANLNAELYTVEHAGHGVTMEKSADVNKRLHEFYKESELHIQRIYETIGTPSILCTTY